MDFFRPVFAPGPVVWVGVVQEGDQIMAAVGKDLVIGTAGFGTSIPDALRDLARALEKEGVTAGPLAASPRPTLRLIKPGATQEG